MDPIHQTIQVCAQTEWNGTITHAVSFAESGLKATLFYLCSNMPSF